MDLPSDCRGFDGIDPGTGERRNLYLRDKEMDRAVKIGPGRVKELAFTSVVRLGKGKFRQREFAGES